MVQKQYHFYMPIFTTISTNARAKEVAASILNSTKNGHNSLLYTWRTCITQVWDDQDPAAIIAELGTDAAEIFAISTRTYLFLESNEPGCTLSYLAKVQPYTVHPNGTVTID